MKDSNGMGRVRVGQALAIVGTIATILAGLAAIFPDTFTIRGTPPLSAVLVLALPLAVGCSFVYLVYLDRRLRSLVRDHQTLLAEQERIRTTAFRTPAYEFARRVMGSEGQPRPN